MSSSKEKAGCTLAACPRSVRPAFKDLRYVRRRRQMEKVCPMGPINRGGTEPSLPDFYQRAGGQRFNLAQNLWQQRADAFDVVGFHHKDDHCTRQRPLLVLNAAIGGYENIEL